MQRESGLIFFWAGVLIMFSYTAFSFLWALAGVSMPYPLAVESESLSLFPLLTPPIGAFLMILGGLIYGLNKKR